MDGKEIEAAADALLQANGISYSATLVQRGAIDAPTEKGGKGWEHDAWRVTFRTLGGREFEQSFKTGIGHRVYPKGWPHEDKRLTRGTIAWAEQEKRKAPVPPKAASILYSLVMDDPHGESFESWADNFGYDSDSRKALAVYMECQRQTDAAKRFFGPELWAAIVSTVEGY